MTNPYQMAELWRGELLESIHCGHAVISDAAGHIVEAWGNPKTLIYPRSSCKMIQALPLVESAAANAEWLTARHLALACASHNGAEIHTKLVSSWLNDLGLGPADLRCGAHMPKDEAARNSLIRNHHSPCQIHNNCSGKHAGFLMLNQYLNGEPEYIEPEHPVQKTVRSVFEEITEERSPNFGIDGCSAPNFATSLAGLARAMAKFAKASGSDTRERSMIRLREAMVSYPDLVAGEGRCCTELMRAMDGVAIKTGAEAVFVAIVPKKGLGIALKIVDGSTRAAELAIAALLVHIGVLSKDHPATRKYLDRNQTNWRGLETGIFKAAPGFPV